MTPETAADIERESQVLACIFHADTAELSPSLARVLALRKHIFESAYLEIASAIQRVRDDGDPVNAYTVGRYVHADVLPTLNRVAAMSDNGALPEDIAELEAADLLKLVPAEALAGVKTKAPIVELLKQREFNPANRLPEPPVIYGLARTPVSTPENLMSLYAQIKSGKSSAFGAIAASTMRESEEADCLGFESSNPEKKILVHVDTEQCPYDHQVWNETVRRRARIAERPAWFRSWCLTGLGYKKTWECLVEAVRASYELSGLHSILIDGVGDLVASVNDEIECNDRIAQLMDMAIRYHCPIITSIHQNPGADKTGKTRGHLGSQLERKVETNLRLEKAAAGAIVMWSDKQRRAPILKSTGPCFAWSNEAGMHVSVATRQSAKDAEKRDKLRAVFEDVFNGRPSMRYSDLVTTLTERLRVDPSNAERKVAQAVALTAINKAAVGLYVLSTPA